MAVEIRVRAQFPDKSSSLESANWNWAHCLTFPVGKVRTLRLSHKPYRWIQYATSVVVGARGHLSRHKDSPFVHIDYDDDLPESSIDLYYQVGEESQRMFPLDAKLADTRSQTPSAASTGAMNFRRDVGERDGNSCVLTNIPKDSCDAAHLISHSKGSSYICSFTTARSRQEDGSDIIEDIDDIRNGLFVNKTAHSVLGSDAAILVTPNFALRTEDLILQGDAVLAEDGKRFTAHIFDTDHPYLLGLNALGRPVSRSAIRVPDEHYISKWPPDILFEAVYGSAVVRHFGCELDKILAPWRGRFYPPEEPVTASQKDQLDQQMDKNLRSLKPIRENAERDDRGQTRAKNAPTMDGFDVLMFLPYIFMTPEKVMEDRRKRQEEMAAREREALEAKVISWIEEIPPND